MANYSIRTKVSMSFDQAVAKTREALKEQGFGVITEIDVRRTVKEKLGEDFRPYLILGACNPKLAHGALTADPDIGLLMPCNVCIWDNQDGTCMVAAVDVKALFQLVDNAEMKQTAETVRSRLKAVVDRMEAGQKAL